MRIPIPTFVAFVDYVLSSDDHGEVRSISGSTGERCACSLMQYLGRMSRGPIWAHSSHSKHRYWSCRRRGQR
jgi:hypothetical protein